jgi:hypothetical protein
MLLPEYLAVQVEIALKANEEPFPDKASAACAGVVEVNRPIERTIDTIREIFISLL